MAEKDCIFCKIVKGEIKSEIVYSDDNFIGILDINPKALGHTLIISKNHFKTILEVPSTLGTELLGAIKEVGLKLIKDKKDLYILKEDGKKILTQEGKNLIYEALKEGLNINGGSNDDFRLKAIIDTVPIPYLQKGGCVFYFDYKY